MGHRNVRINGVGLKSYAVGADAECPPSRTKNRINRRGRACPGPIFLVFSFSTKVENRRFAHSVGFQSHAIYSHAIIRTALDVTLKHYSRQELQTTLIPSVIGLAKLAKMSFDGADMAPLWTQLTARFSEDQANAEARQTMYAALMEMCLIDQMRGDPERGLQFQAQALEECRLYQIPATAAPAKLTILGFVMAGRINANTPIEFLIEDTEITLLLLYVSPGCPLPEVPEHDLAIVLVAESEQAKPVLRELENLTANWPRPVLNKPDQVPQIGRDCLYQLLAPIAGVQIPATVCVKRGAIHSLPHGVRFPMIIRPVDSHAGDGLEKVDSATEAEDYLERHSETEFYLSPFQDYRSADGQYRKYRIMIVGGQPFPCHMGISDHWMIHYLNAGMTESAEKRREEAQFMDCFQADFGRRHGHALAEIADVLGLDYFGLDCAETPSGELLIFEASTALVVHRMDPPEIFPYKGPHMAILFQAFQDLLFRKANFSPV
jgi:glutathione synthase/RimK-type ligase-like ATP-grasp enzyme